MSTQVLLISRGLFHDGLVRILENYPADIEIVGSAETWEEARTLLDVLHPDALIADYQYADEIIADMETLSIINDRPTKVLFIILDENKIVVYQRQQFADITIDRLIEAL